MGKKRIGDLTPDDFNSLLYEDELVELLLGMYSDTPKDLVNSLLRYGQYLHEQRDIHNDFNPLNFFKSPEQLNIKRTLSFLDRVYFYLFENIPIQSYGDAIPKKCYILEGLLESFN